MPFVRQKNVLQAIPENTDNAKPVGAGLLAKNSSAPRLTSPHALSLTTIAGKPAPTKDRAHADNVHATAKNTTNAIPVGASLLAKNSSAPRLTSPHALSLTTIAGKPASTKNRAHADNEVTCKSLKAPRKKTRDPWGGSRVFRSRPGNQPAVWAWATPARRSCFCRTG